MPTRRDFLHLTCLGTPLLLLPSLAHPSQGAPGMRRLSSLAGVDSGALPVDAATPGARITFGLFFDEADLSALQERFSSEPKFASLQQRLSTFDREAERRFLESEVQYNDHLIHIARVSGTAQDMAFYYAMTDDEDAGSLSIDAVRSLMSFPHWDYFLEADEHIIGLQRAPAASMAVALASDWLGDLVDEEERTEWLRTMGMRGLEPNYRALHGMRHPDQVAGWTIDESSTYFEHRPGDRMDLSNWPRILDRTNLKAVPASALAVGTAAYRRRFGDDDASDRWQEQAVFSLRTFRDLFAADGSYDEGVSYANYTTVHLAQAAAVLWRLFDLDLYDILDWTGYVDFLREMAMPTAEEPYAIVNFGDSSGGATAAVPYWTAGRSRDGRSQWFGETMTAEHDEWSLIWYDPDVTPDPPPDRPHLWQSDLDWMVARTGYSADDLVVAMRSGGPANHEHADRNGIIVKCFGEQLVADPYRPPYSFSDPSWMMRTTEGHSALLIDGRGHQYHDGSEGTNPSDAAARIVRVTERDGYSAWTSDATPAYRLVLPDVASVTRTMIVLYEFPAVIVIDKVLKERDPSRIQARFFGYNRDGRGRVEAGESGFRSIRPGAALTGSATSPMGAAARTDVLPIPEETARLHPFAEISTQEASLTPVLATVLIPERGTDGEANIAFSASGGDAYEVVGSLGDRRFRCVIHDTDAIPEFEIEV